MNTSVWTGGRSSLKAASVPLLVLVSLAGVVRAERLPIRTYGIVDGLSRNQINDIMQDSRGYIWFCTSDGVSRFDGYQFRNYGGSDGLPSGPAFEMVETHNGDYFIAASDELYIFDPLASRRVPPGRPFTEFKITGVASPQSVNVLCAAPSGVVWCGVDSDLYRLDRAGGLWRAEKVARDGAHAPPITALLEGSDGTLWIGTTEGLFRRQRDGVWANCDPGGAVGGSRVRALAADSWGFVWVGTQTQIARLPAKNSTGTARPASSFVLGKDLPGVSTRSILVTDGIVWVGTIGGLTRFSLDAAGNVSSIRSFTRANGLSQEDLQALAEDRDGNIWAGTENGGAMKITPRGLVSYDERDGLKQTRIAALFEDRSGELIAFTSYWGHIFFHRWDGSRFDAISPLVPGGIRHSGWGTHQVALQDSAGEWWMGTGQGLYRYPRLDDVAALARTPPRDVYRFAFIESGIDDVFRVYEDRRGDIWLNAMSSQSREYTWRWSRKDSSLRPNRDGLPIHHPTAFAEDAAGSLWIGFYNGAWLARVRGDRVDLFTEADGLRDSFAFDIHIDRSGELWLATSAGVAHCRNPGADHPRFETWSKMEGLASHDVRCIAEDQYGRLYFGSGRGITRFDPRTESMRHYTTDDGLANPEVLVAYRDRHDDIWFGTEQGLSRLVPSEDPPARPPAVYITAARFGGQPYGISETGDLAIGPMTLQPGQNRVQIEFVGIGFAPGESMRYQYRLDGLDRDWGEATGRRAVDYAGLRPGAYRFVVRSVSSSGLVSDRPASANFSILRPLWLRWWFLGIAALALAAAVYAYHHLRVQRLRMIEQVRTRIATDLHDDIGSSLTQMSIMSEVARQQLSGRDESASQIVSKVAETSRELVDSMSDIVWAINPKRDSLQDLVYRMHRLASDVLTARDVSFDFAAEGRIDTTTLSPGSRRDIFLIYKEALNNVARHSQCTEVQISIAADGSWLDIRLRDNGRGFDPSATYDGNGMGSMRSRAASLGGNIQITSATGKGSDVHARIPLKQRGTA
ncbi:MAG: two-component regulator propeller domain-containing protein [Acidobacteriota bacterium]